MLHGGVPGLWPANPVHLCGLSAWQLEGAQQELESVKQQLRALEQKHAGEVPLSDQEMKKLREQARPGTPAVQGWPSASHPWRTPPRPFRPSSCTCHCYILEAATGGR